MEKPENAKELFYPLNNRLYFLITQKNNKFSLPKDYEKGFSDVINGVMWFPSEDVLAEIDIALDRIEISMAKGHSIMNNFKKSVEGMINNRQFHEDDELFPIASGEDVREVYNKNLYTSIAAELQYYKDNLIPMKEELLRSLGAHVKRTNTRTEKVKGLDLQLKKGKTINDFKQALEKFIHEDTEEDHITSIFFSNKFLSDERIIWKHREKSPEIIQQSLIALLDAMKSKKKPQPSIKEALNAYSVFFKRPLDKRINKPGEIINISEDTISKYLKVEEETPDKYSIKSIVNEFVE
jgi:hypothetical protein